MGRKISGRIKKDLKKKIDNAKKVIFFLDYDGTLTPIRKRPSLAKLEKSTKALLERLAGNPRTEVFIISGRILKDVKKRVGLKSLHYIGNHGIELEGKGMKYVHPVAKDIQPSIEECYQVLKRRLKYKGVILENKLYTLSVHYRLVAQKDIPRLTAAFKSAASELEKNKNIKIMEGKKVFEIQPDIKWDKGAIVNWVLKRKNIKKSLPICIGDDKTDEDAFRAIGKKGITILVSRKPKKTFARYRVNSPGDVARLLKWCSHELMDQKS